MSSSIREKSASSRRYHRQLWLGTGLTGAVAILCLGAGYAPAAVRHPFAPILMNQARSEPPVAADAPQDLTISVPAGTQITTDGYGEGGITASNPAGGITITATGTSVTTLGERSDGIGAIGYNGDLTIHAGDVSTAGYLSRGVFADTATGNIAIDANSVTTSGNLASGISAHTVYGNIAVSAGSVYTYGYGAQGVYASSSQGSATVQVGTVRASGPASQGIVVYSEGTTTITADNVSTGVGYAEPATSRGIVAVGTAVNVNVSGSVYTHGDNSDGVFARTNLVYSDPTVVADISVSAGRVTTDGSYSHGIMALNYSANGKIGITAGNVVTTGTQALGIYAGGNGDIAISADNVTTSGASSLGIGAKTYGGDIMIAAGSVTTSGTGSTGISAFNYSESGSTSVTANSVGTHRDYAVGIVAEGFGNVSVDAQQISTAGYKSAGVIGYSAAGNLAVTVGNIKTSGDIGTGIVAYAFGQTSHVDVTAGSIETGGTLSQGLELITLGDATVNIGSVTTSGVASDAINVNTNNFDTRTADGKPLDTDIAVGDITTSGAGSRGIIVEAEGDLNITANSIETSGDRYTHAHDTFFAEGIATRGIDGDTNITVGSVKTAGDGAVAIAANQYLGDLTITAGAIETTGFHGNGVLARVVYGNANLELGSVTTSGDYGVGVTGIAIGYPVDGNDKLTITADTVATSGKFAYGVVASAYGDVSLDIGTVSTQGAYAQAITAQSTYGNVQIQAGTVTASGAGSGGIAAIAPYGDVIITAGTVSTSGAYVPANPDNGLPGRAADAIYAVGNAVSVTTTGAVSTTGDQARAIAAIGLGTGDLTINTSGPVTTAGRQAIGILAYQYGQGGITITAASVTAAGDGAKGIYAVAPTAAVAITAGSVTTTGAFLVGDDYTPFSRTSAITAVGGSVAVAADKVSTTGNYAYGVKAISLAGPATIKVGSVSAAGDYSEGVRVASYGSADVEVGSVATSGNNDRAVTVSAYGDATVNVTGPIKMTGTGANGIFVSSVGGNVAVATSGAIDIAGESSTGIGVASTGGSVAVAATGAVNISGFNVVGIGASVSAPRSGGEPYSRVIAKEARAGNAPGVMITAGDVAATGTITTAISAYNGLGGDISVSAHNIVSTDHGINATGTGAVNIQVGSVTSGSLAIESLSGTDNTVTVSGAVQSGVTSAILADSLAGNVTVNVGKVASIVGGGTSKLESLVGYYGQGVAMYVRHQTATLNNAGTVATTGDGFAVQVNDLADGTDGPAGHAVINNSGTILGAVMLTEGDDLLTNSGTLVTTKNSDFGAGSDNFVNTGSVVIPAGEKPSAIMFTGLESFQNAGGLVDLRNGTIGDRLTLPGSYVGSAGARLGLDIAADGSGADMLVVAGAATGHSNILLSVSGKTATLLGKSVTLVQAGIGTSPDAFTIANADVGFIHYGLAFSGATNGFSLTTQAGAPVYRMLAIPRASQAIWQRAADAWETHMAEKRDARAAGDEGFGQRLWGQFYGGVDTLDSRRVINGTRTNTGTRQDYYGAEIGLDLAGKVTDKGGMLFGVTASYLSSTLNGQGSGDRARYDTVEVGGYASLISGAFFANGLVQYGHDWIAASSTPTAWSDKLKDDNYGGQIQIGARLGSGSLYAEPLASLSFVRSDVGNLDALGQTVDFDKREGLRGKLGGRVGGLIDIPGHGKATFYLQASYVHEFQGKDGLDFLSGGTSQKISGVRPGDYGQGTLGVNIFSLGRASGFIEGDADVGGSTKGGGGRIGISFKL